MRVFIIKSILFSTLAGILYLAAGFAANGSTDDFYQRFSTPKKPSLILGTSKAAQGILPTVLDSVLHEAQYASPFFNFAFTVENSPYGPTYFDAIKKKLDPNTKNGLFIVVVDPWSISSKNDVHEDSLLFRENFHSLASIPSVTAKPNWRYLSKYISKGWGSIFITKLENRLYQFINKKATTTKHSWTYVHDDGWLEVITPIDQKTVARRTQKKIKDYRATVNSNTISSVRIAYLKQTIKFLKNHGQVYLFRLPVHPEIELIANQLHPKFDAEMLNIAHDYKVTYHSYMSQSSAYLFTDGNHLYKNSCRQISAQIGEYILSKQ
jgi:hypothetical protein